LWRLVAPCGGVSWLPTPGGNACEATSASSDAADEAPLALNSLYNPSSTTSQLGQGQIPLPSTMRFLSILASASALVATAFAAEQSSQERFIKFGRLSQLSTPLLLNDLSYKSLTAAPRDYSVAIVLTAQDTRFGCQLCREFKPEWELVAQSWARGDRRQESRIFFAVLDFSEGRDTFVSV
jgi:hypothetical protein